MESLLHKIKDFVRKYTIRQSIHRIFTSSNTQVSAGIEFRELLDKGP